MDGNVLCYFNQKMKQISRQSLHYFKFCQDEM